jgi:hypothetical protein
MAETVLRGPAVVVGALMDGRVEPFDGPSIGYQGDVIADPRVSPLAKDGLAPGRVPGFYNAFYTVSVDAIPSTASTTTIGASQTPSTTAGVALALVTAQAGTAAGVPVFSPGIPIVPQGTTKVVTVSAIDFGFATGTTTAASTTVVVDDNTKFTLGQWLVMPGCGGNSTAPLFTQVQSITTGNYTGITVSPAPATGLSNNPIGQANLYSQLLPPAASFGPSAPAPTAAEPYRLAGLAKSFDPAQAVARNVTVQSAATASGTGTFLVTGYDVYGFLMTELITSSGTAATAGKKAFKYIQSVAPVTAGTTVTPPAVTVGVGNLVGMNFRSDKWEYTDIFFNGGFASNNTGWTAAATTAPATSATGDVRGTQNCSTILSGGAGGTGVAGGGFNGVARLTVFQNIPMLAAFNATPTNSISLFGVAQSTT